MRKGLAVLLALLLPLTMVTGGYALDDQPDPSQVPREESETVHLRLNDEGEGVYHVTIAWGDLRFTYNTGSWNTSSLSYRAGAWRERTDTQDTHAEIKVTSRSNREVQVGFRWQSKEGSYGGNVTDHGAVFTLNRTKVMLAPAFDQPQSVVCKITPTGNPGEFPGHWSGEFLPSEVVVVEIGSGGLY